MVSEAGVQVSTSTKRSRALAVSELIRLRSQYGTLLVLAPALWSLFIAAGGRPGAHYLIVFIVGAFLMRSAGCAINDIADRRFDGFVERTKTRPLADGSLRPVEAVVVFAVFVLASFALVLTLNRLTIALSFVAIALAAGYPFVKRVSHFPQTVLGMAFGWGAVMAWTSVRGSIAVTPVLIFAANIFWSMAYDTIYALMDVRDDRRIGVKSTAIFFGERVYTALAVMYFLMAVCLVLTGVSAGLGVLYYIGVALSFVVFIAATFMVRQRPATAADSFSRAAAFTSFRMNAWGGVILLAFIAADLNLSV